MAAAAAVIQAAKRAGELTKKVQRVLVSSESPAPPTVTGRRRRYRAGKDLREGCHVDHRARHGVKRSLTHPQKKKRPGGTHNTACNKSVERGIRRRRKEFSTTGRIQGKNAKDPAKNQKRSTYKYVLVPQKRTVTKKQRQDEKKKMGGSVGREKALCRRTPYDRTS